MADDSALRAHLISLLDGGNAHATFDSVVRGFPVAKAGVRPKGLPYSAWELLEHLRIAQHDIVQFSLSAEHQSPQWPEGYWPAKPGPEKETDWARSVRQIRKDLAEFKDVIQDAKQDLHRKFPWGDGQTLLREALLIADHNAYHIGQLVLVRRLLGEWTK
jgi:uncharacterized damage-inducible protein DinB